MSDVEYWMLQVFNTPSGKYFWDCAFWERKLTDEKGVATFKDSTPRLSWMSDRTFKEVWAYINQKKREGRLDFVFTKENENVLNDLFSRR